MTSIQNTETWLTGIITFTGDLLPVPLFAEGWILFVTLIPLLLYIIVLFSMRSPALSLSRIIFSARFAAAAFRNRAPGAGRGEILLTITSLGGLASLLYFSAMTFGFTFFGLQGLRFWLFGLGLFSLSYGARFLMLIIAGEMTGTREVFREYGYNVAQLYRFTAILLLPVNFIIPYLDILPDRIVILTTVGLLSILILVRLSRVVTLFMRGRYSIFYLILYLCALEFTPVLVITRYLYGKVY